MACTCSNTTSSTGCESCVDVFNSECVYYKGSISNNLALGSNFRLNTFIENTITRLNALPSSLTDTYILTITPTYPQGPLYPRVTFSSTGVTPTQHILNLDVRLYAASANWTTGNNIPISSSSTPLTFASVIANYGHRATGTTPHSSITIADSTGGLTPHNTRHNISVDLNYKIPTSNTTAGTIVVQLLIAGNVVKTMFKTVVPSATTMDAISFYYMSGEVNSGSTVAVNVSLRNSSDTTVNGSIDILGGGISVVETGS
jgi:hypothetical protein